VIANVAGSVDVSIDKSGGDTRVTVSAGSQYQATLAGTVIVKQ
jgi:hypothetical protein